MHTRDLSPWRHSHRFETGGEDGAARRTRVVLVLTLVTMVVEITAGTVFNSMALLADGWHMSTHAAAMGIAMAAYAFARRHADDPRFAFGTGKVGSLAGFASAAVLGLTALLMAWESVQRLLSVQVIAFAEALTVAVLGLVVNLVSAFILGGHGHGHGHGHDHDDHDHHHHDHNLRAAYLHVLADALTSVLAVAALLAGKAYGWWWLDPAMGLVGAAVIGRWAWGLLRQSGAVLLDMSGEDGMARSVRAAMEGDGETRVADLHLWQVGPGHLAAIVAVVAGTPRPVDYYRDRLAGLAGLSHVTIEVHSCAGSE
ncbi:CDF family Co(II)/Ni(II) efflux transporter DmeF [Magnetospirillum sp. UT-4]|uniref:CDF family Co(II)/Ni(II) efflux transporter DmeF n=1 Tax=Magnetospirillum sp. UT-4 TaxID=2681467 RepID=UPI0013853697|nr:CDF family Co(II)/Ni(II) efflux transporter DmeF [Magnetospirillum sp. UT-4]CAA7615213.1 Co/Zn/Cd efflux system component [Magnetospirillum sp. UT-4]